MSFVGNLQQAKSQLSAPLVFLTLDAADDGVYDAFIARGGGEAAWQHRSIGRVDGRLRMHFQRQQPDEVHSRHCSVQ